MSQVPLIIAPLREEIAPLLDQCRGTQVLRAGALHLYSGHLAGRELRVAVLGDGAMAAERGLQRLLQEVTPGRVLLIGLAGGLSDDLPAGALVQARAVRPLEDAQGATAQDASIPDLARATIVSAPRILSTAESKQQAWDALDNPPRCVVDLESATLTRQLEEFSLPWTVVRAVSDSQDEDLPLDFARLSNAEGSIERSRILAALLRRPMALGGLLRMRSRARSCALTLSRAATDWLSL
jgi:nucleoside phosphorylase